MSTKRFFKTRICSLAILLATPRFAAPPADPGKLTVHVDNPTHKIPPSLYGLMTEEINHSYDGGLYSELIQNRAFKDDAKTPVHWTLLTSGESTGKISLDNTDPVNDSLPTSLRLDNINHLRGERMGVSNDGFWGIPIRPDTTYILKFYAKVSPDYQGGLAAEIAGNPGRGITANVVVALTTKWEQYTLTLKTPADVKPSSANRLNLLAMPGKGTIWFSQVSLMPPTFNNRPNGNRPDLMKLMADMNPAFLRLPGGNYLEGNTIAERFNWKATLGPLENRPGHMCPWGYRSSDGMGLLEYLQWCEDLKMDPVLAVFAGYALQGEHVTGAALQPHVQDALDEIEYVTGDASTTWGAQRVKDGHPAPFKLTYVEIGNEDQFDQSKTYDSRFTQFYDAIKAKYPQLQLIATIPVQSRKPDVVDDHYYRSAAAMENDVHHYDNAPRTGPKIFVGEWATTEGSPTPTMQAALGDAAWLTGMERNSDLIVMSCYAPLLVNVNPGARQWGTNLIGYDALKSYGSPSYYVQKMFNLNRGDTVLPVDLVPQIAKSALPVPAPHGGVGVASWATNVQYKDLKVAKPDGTVLYTSDFSKGTPPLDGWKFFKGDWKADAGMIHQIGNDTECRAITGDPAWGDVDYTLKACKLSGSEGFMVMFDVKDQDNYMWFNVGGWTNTRTALEVAEGGARRTIGNDSTLTVENNRWYDVKIEARGNKVTCFVDGKQIIAATYEPPATPDPLYATASRDDAIGGGGDVIVKVVNVNAAPQQLELNLQGLATVNPTASLEVIAGDPTAVNTIEEPEKVAPKKSTIASASPRFTHEFPGNSVSILRFKTK